MPQLSTFSAREAAATLRMHAGRPLRASARVTGAAKPCALSSKALASNDEARFLPSSTSLPSQNGGAPRVRVFEKLASAVAINVSLVLKLEHENLAGRMRRGARRKQRTFRCIVDRSISRVMTRGVEFQNAADPRRRFSLTLLSLSLPSQKNRPSSPASRTSRAAPQ